MKLTYSIVIPYGKIEGNFLRCINSALNQNIPPIKIWVICNGQITNEFIKNLLDANSNLKINLIEFIFPENCTNANLARNCGLYKTTSKWVAFLDSDDWWDSDWSSNVQETIELNNCDFLYGSLRVYGKNNASSDLICRHYKEFTSPENYLLSYLPAQTSTFFVNTNLAKNVGWNNSIRRHQDYDFFVRLVKSNPIVSIVENISVNVDWSTARRHKYHRDCLQIIKKWRPRVEKKNYLRHLNNLRKSAFYSKDWFAHISITKELLFSIIQKSNYL